MTVRTQTRYPTTVVSDDAVGTLPWSDPEKAEVEDNDPATATGPGTTEWLLASGYGFESALPSTCDLIEIALLPRRRDGAGTQEITVVGTETATASGSGVAVTVDVPAGTSGDGSAGSDVLVLTLEQNGTINPPAQTGWTSIGVGNMIDGAFTGLRGMRMYYRIADNEPASYTLNASPAVASNVRTANITTLRGVDAANPLASNVSVFSTSSQGVHTTLGQGVTTTVDDAFLIWASGHGVWANPGTISDPGLMSLVASTGSPMFVRIYSQTLASAGSTGTKSIICENATYHMGVMVAFRPGPAPIYDSAIRLVVGGVVGDGDRSSTDAWPLTYETKTHSGTIAEWGFPDLAVGDIDSDFGGAMSVTISAAAQDVDVDALPIRISYDVPMSVTITAPTADITQPNPTVTWDAEVDSSAITQASSRVRILARPSLAVLYDSGVVAGATQAHVVGSGTPSTPWAAPQQGQAIRIEVTVTEDGTADPDGTGPAIEGSATFDCTTDFLLPAAPTGLAAVAVTEAS